MIQFNSNFSKCEKSEYMKNITCFFLFAFLTERIFWKISAPSLKFIFVLPLSEVIKKSNSPTYWHVRRKTQLFVRKFTPLAHLLVFSRFTASKSSTKLKWSIKVMSHSFSSSAKFSSFPETHTYMYVSGGKKC